MELLFERCPVLPVDSSLSLARYHHISRQTLTQALQQKQSNPSRCALLLMRVAQLITKSLPLHQDAQLPENATILLQLDQIAAVALRNLEELQKKVATGVGGGATGTPAAGGGGALGVSAPPGMLPVGFGLGLGFGSGSINGGKGYNETDPTSSSPLVTTGDPSPVSSNTTLPGLSMHEMRRNRDQMLRTVHISAELFYVFANYAQAATKYNCEFVAILAGKNMQPPTENGHTDQRQSLSLSQDIVVTALVIPKQEAKPMEECCIMDEEQLFALQEIKGIFTVGWIHTHPYEGTGLAQKPKDNKRHIRNDSNDDDDGNDNDDDDDDDDHLDHHKDQQQQHQGGEEPYWGLTATDMHTHAGFQSLMPEAIAVVMPIDIGEGNISKSESNQWRVYSLTEPTGINAIMECTERGHHRHRNEQDLYWDASHVRVYYDNSLQFKLYDLRQG